jgi:hypothetical protein
MPYEDPVPPPVMMRDIVQHSAEEKDKIILGIDAYTHHTLWRNTDINPMGELLMEYMVSTKLNIPNKGNVPTILNVKRRQVIDLTLKTTLVGNLVSDLHVSIEESLSDLTRKCVKMEYSDVYRQKSGWCRYLYSILTHFLSFNRSWFSFYNNIFLILDIYVSKLNDKYLGL